LLLVALRCKREIGQRHQIIHQSLDTHVNVLSNV